MSHPIFIVDAFALKPFGGNPAAVVILDEDEPDPTDDYLQAVAREMNLSETAFVAPREEHGHFGLRWFTPVREVDLCGHATLASAQVLYDNGKVDLHTPLIFHTRSGELEARPFMDTEGSFAEGHAGGVGVKLRFPADASQEHDLPERMLSVLGVPEERVVFTGRGTRERQVDWLIEVDDASVVRAAEPDYDDLSALLVDPARGVILTSAHDGNPIDVVSRCFYPTYGIDEDPVTGSAHTLIGPHFAKKLDKSTLHCLQASERGGEMLVTVENSHVLLIGRAVTVVRGHITVEKV